METVEKDIKVGNGTKKMQEISKIFNKSSSISELKIKFALADIDFDKAEQEYTRLVASKWPKFLDMFKHSNKDVFSFKRYMDIGAQTSSVNNKSPKPRLPCSIKKTSTQVAMKTAGDDGCRKFGCHCRSFKILEEFIHGIDFEAEMVKTMLYNLTFAS